MFDLSDVPAPLPVTADIRTLSEREKEVVRLLASGLEAHEIAPRLGVARKTVYTHRTGILAKLGLTNNAQLTLFAVREGLVTP